MDDLTTTQGIAALAAAGVGLVALLWAIVLAVKLRRMRSAQRTVMGEGQADLVAHAAQIQEAFVQLRDWVEESATRLEERMATAEADSTAASPTPRWSATTQWASCPGSSRARWRCSTRTGRESSSPRSSIATRRACT